MMPLPITHAATVHEFKCLVAAHLFELTALGNNHAENAARWAVVDPGGYAVFVAALTAFVAKITALRPMAAQIIGEADKATWDTTVATDLTTMGPAWDEWLTTWMTGEAWNADDGIPAQPGPGGFDSLDTMVSAAALAYPKDITYVDYKGIPQPDAPDMELQAYQLADRAVKVIEKVGIATGEIVAIVGLGLGLAWALGQSHNSGLRKPV